MKFVYIPTKTFDLFGGLLYLIEGVRVKRNHTKALLTKVCRMVDSASASDAIHVCYIS